MHTLSFVIAMMLLLAPVPAIARTSAISGPAQCAATPGRASGLSSVAIEKSLSQLSITFDREQENTLFFNGASILEGPCANDVYAFKMSQIAFRDGAVFNTKSHHGQFVHTPDAGSLTGSWGLAVPDVHPEIARAEFIMASRVDGGRHSLEVGVWKNGDDYIVAAFMWRNGSFSTPVELLRSSQPLRSVTFFPSPDMNGGRLGLLQENESTIMLVSVDWNHAALSKMLVPDQ